MHFWSPTYVPHAPPISFSLIWLPEYLARSMNHEASNYAVFSSLLLLCSVQLATLQFILSTGGLYIQTWVRAHMQTHTVVKYQFGNTDTSSCIPL